MLLSTRDFVLIEETDAQAGLDTLRPHNTGDPPQYQIGTKVQLTGSRNGGTPPSYSKSGLARQNDELGSKNTAISIRRCLQNGQSIDRIILLYYNIFNL